MEDRFFKAILNIRAGFATNSSSSHSLLFIRWKRPDDVASLQDVIVDEEDLGRFGWEEFLLVSKEAKMKYLLAALVGSFGQFAYLSGKHPQPYTKEEIYEHQEIWGKFERFDVNDALKGEDIAWMDTLTASDILGVTVPVEHSENYHLPYIDHDSNFTMPQCYTRSGVNGEYIVDMQRFLSQDEIVVVGGNSESEDIPDFPTKETIEKTKKIIRFNIPDFEGWVARKDRVKGIWSVFNPQSGDKLRLNFDRLEGMEGFDGVRNTQLAIPELIDLKITSYCPYGCRYCYQSSTFQGQHADLATIEQALDVLSSLEVFEVAIGGGEPTLHPDFFQIIQMCHDRYIVPNFSTRNYTDYKKWKFISDIIGGFAFSIDSEPRLKSFRSLFRVKHKVEHKLLNLSLKASVQYVMGSTPYDVFLSIVELCLKERVPLTLLAYKHVGRGRSVIPFPYDNWVEDIKKRHRYALIPNNTSRGLISIDTELARLHEAELEEAGYPIEIYETKEGLTSFYVDCVDKKVAQSSFCSEQAHYNTKADLHYILSRIDLWEERKNEIPLKMPILQRWIEDTEDLYFEYD